MLTTASRKHSFSYGHRVTGHESKCAQMHGHNGTVTFHVKSKTGLDGLGRVIDFSVIKQLLCQWIEDNWDHRFLMWEEDPLLHHVSFLPGITPVPFNPTAENMAAHLLRVVGPTALLYLNVELIAVEFFETDKCSACVSSI